MMELFFNILLSVTFFMISLGLVSIAVTIVAACWSIMNDLFFRKDDTD